MINALLGPQILGYFKDEFKASLKSLWANRLLVLDIAHRWLFILMVCSHWGTIW